MCTKNICRRSPCGLQVLLGVLWVTLLLTVSILGVAYLFLQDAKVEVSLGQQDEYVINFPKLLCSSVKIEKHNHINGYQSWGTGCVMEAKRDEYGAQKEIRQSESYSMTLYKQSDKNLGRANSLIVTHRMKSRTSVPLYWSTHKIDDWTKYDYKMTASAHLSDPNSHLIIQTASYSSPSELKKHSKLDGNLCEIDNPETGSVGRSFSVEQTDQGVQSKIVVFCATSTSYVDSYDNVTLNVDFDILKFNEVLGVENSCSNPPDDVEVHCVEEFGEENNDKDTECDVPLKIITGPYFDNHVYSMKTPVVIVVDSGVLDFTVTCKIRVGWFYFICAVETFILAVVMTIAVCCFKRRNAPF